MLTKELKSEPVKIMLHLNHGISKIINKEFVDNAEYQ